MKYEEFTKKWNDLTSYRIIHLDIKKTSPWMDSDLSLIGYCTISTNDLRQISVCTEDYKERDITSIDGVLDVLDQALKQEIEIITSEKESYFLKTMNENVVTFILGAGFSNSFGLPLMKDLFRESLKWHSRDKRLAVNKEQFEKLNNHFPFSYFKNYENSNLEIFLVIWRNHIESMLQYGNAQYVNEQELLYEVYINNLVSGFFSWSASALDNHKNLFEDFARLLRDLCSKYDVRFITFNYDTILEQSINLARGQEINNASGNFFYLNELKKDTNDIAVRKMHGSINWIEFNSKSTIKDRRNPSIKSIELYSRPKLFIYSAPHLDDKIYDVAGTPYIIAPAMSKYYQHLYTKTILQALNDLSCSKKVIIIGYSFPDQDFILDKPLIKRVNDSGSEIQVIDKSADVGDKLRSRLSQDKYHFIEDAWTVEHIRRILL